MQNKQMLLTVGTLLLGVLGSCLGFLWGVLTGPLTVGMGECGACLDVHGGGASLWVLGFTAIGTIQGACVAPAWHLGQGDHGEGRLALRPLCTLIFGSGCLTTSLIALLLWATLGGAPVVALGLGVGMAILCAPPLCAYILGRREFSPPVPVHL